MEIEMRYRKTIRQAYEKVAAKHPEWGSVVAFNIAIAGRGYSRQRIAYWFHKIVKRDEYIRRENRQILNYAYSL